MGDSELIDWAASNPLKLVEMYLFILSEHMDGKVLQVQRQTCLLPHSARYENMRYENQNCMNLCQTFREVDQYVYT